MPKSSRIHVPANAGRVTRHTARIVGSTLRKTGVVLPWKTLNALYLTEKKGAERGGFEPPARVLPEQLLSRQPCSATPAPLRGRLSRAAVEARPSHYRGMADSPQFTAFSLKQQDEEWAAQDSGDHSDRDLGRSQECACKRIA